MAEDPIKAAELRGYSRGYVAGRKRADSDATHGEVEGRRERFRQDVFLAALPEIIRAPWGREVDGKWKSFNTACGIANSAWSVADEAVKRATFR